MALPLTNPVWAETVKAGEAEYAVTTFPVVIGRAMAIPAGTYVLGQIDAVTKPHWWNPHAEFQMHVGRMIFANGYMLELTDAPAQAATATVHVNVTSRNDVLLDKGAPCDMTVQAPLRQERSDLKRHARTCTSCNFLRIFCGPARRAVSSPISAVPPITTTFGPRSCGSRGMGAVVPVLMIPPTSSLVQSLTRSPISGRSTLRE